EGGRTVGAGVVTKITA
ncbi:hypothetical protein SAHY_18267, partial [Salinisphaera hydrothermalis EPR70]